MRHGMRISMVGLTLATWVAVTHAQGLPPADLPPEIQIPIQEMAFTEPTTIEGRVLYLDTYDDALWIEWVRVQDTAGWRDVPGQRQFMVYPRDAAMMGLLKQLPRNTTIRLRVQRGASGKRMILALDEL